MIILGIDTTSPYCGVSLLKDGALMGNIKLNSGNTHSVVLMPAINNLLKSSGLGMDDIDLFATLLFVTPLLQFLFLRTFRTL